ncbi:MAG TPA: esterase [Pseudomonas sp.]|nr:esterase [Pseudomonadales bacterium]HCB42531.1 esterase [Pseudomonas sp.]HCL42355.1 esterase [Pseudomonas sp.]|tara:strand:+ start:1351 stop:2310 length:960 start_codon:yes stop_codon:yes gene_type:complete
MTLAHESFLFLRQLAEQGAVPFHTLTAEQARAMFSRLREVAGDGPEMLRVEDIAIPVQGATITLRVLQPSAQPDAIVVYLHGGGWVVGDLDDYDALGRYIACESNCAVVLVDYRLAPEHRFPAAIDDAWHATQWVSEHSHRLGLAPRLPLIVAGDSAGANLAAVVALRARDAGAPSLLQQVLIYPVTQPDVNSPGYLDEANQGLLTQADMAWFWDCYLPAVHFRTQVDASPLLAASLAGVAPAVVVTAEHDVLRDEGEAYARKLEEHGVDVSYRQFDGQIHGFFTLLQALPASADARQFIVAQIRQALDGASVDPAVSA